jgi:chaperonin GroES
MKPVGDRVLVKPIADETAEQLKSEGIELAQSVPTELTKGEIRAVGDGPNVTAANFKSGQIVIFSKYQGEEVTINGQIYKFIDFQDILGVETGEEV